MRQFTEEQTMFRESYRRFLAEEIAPHMPAWREAGIIDRGAYKKAGDRGFLMVWPEEKYGGLGDEDFRYEQVIIEETCRAGCGEFYATLHSRLVGPYFKRFGTAEQRDRFLPRCVSGDTILAIAMTEPDAGSDLAGMRSTAEDKGDHFLLNGSKTYISNGINGDVVIVAAKLAGAEKKHALVLLIVERGMEGFERGRNLDKMGQHAQDTAELFFRDVKVPKANVLGEPGQGFYYLMEGLAEERLISAVGAAINARRAFDITRDFVTARKLFGKALAEQQNTQFRMAEMDAEIDLVQTYVDHLVSEHNAGRLTSIQGAKAKMLATEIEWKMVDLGVQLHGGAGYMNEYPICGMFTNARINRILAGSSEVMRLIIGRDVFSQNYQSILS
ncbi:acyl-CoA dehydrogenase family protein [Novosphingobium sp. Fuku2-ISO-50]|uniref:acyl-CoA dehydrogenase family protein n=1 Tax=Novosphingobium sp. Fuku2-ISO-50 TaxID=1739114 RepID=UPI00076DEA7E|nr:acyl-CoA dehydrogenase family protein [Novosphingobium sp. Fuku2-ISO-50]KUR73907.1 acyl-CoA dehydrogenase [Novosphingobium sp. Fuku2-ISO-50]